MKPSTHEYLGYVFKISDQPHEPAFKVDFADFAEIITSGGSLSHAFTNACEALDLHLESLRKLGRRVPKPKHRVLVEAV
jgi:predicted RNase H-like HicB family nuclease